MTTDTPAEGSQAEGAGTAGLAGWLPAASVYAMLTAFNIALHASIVNADVWVRLASGRLVVDHHIIPRHDPFTFTVRGEPWLDHEWLLGAATYVANSVSYELLVFIAAVLAVSPFIAMHLLATKTRHNDWLLTALVALAFAAAWRSCAIRPQLVNPVFFVALVWLIDDFRRQESNRIWLAVPLTFAWANLQAGFPVALAVLAAWCAVCLLERRTPWRSLAVLVAAVETNSFRRTRLVPQRIRAGALPIRLRL